MNEVIHELYEYQGVAPVECGEYNELLKQALREFDQAYPGVKPTIVKERGITFVFHKDDPNVPMFKVK